MIDIGKTAKRSASSFRKFGARASNVIE